MEQGKVFNVLPDFAQQILCIRPSKTGANASLCWIPNGSGAYTTKYGYFVSVARLEQPDDNSNQSFEWTTEVWNGNFSSKVKGFLWRCASEALATGENLSKRGVNVNTNCIHCEAT